MPESTHELLKRKGTRINVVNDYNGCFRAFYHAECFAFNTSYFAMFYIGFIEIFLAP